MDVLCALAEFTRCLEVGAGTAVERRCQRQSMKYSKFYLSLILTKMHCRRVVQLCRRLLRGFSVCVDDGILEIP